MLMDVQKQRKGPSPARRNQTLNFKHKTVVFSVFFGIQDSNAQFCSEELVAYIQNPEEYPVQDRS